MNKLKAASVLLVVSMILVQCTEKTTPEDDSETQFIVPVPLPDPGIPGFKFPTDSNTINQWVNDMDEESMAKHSWGIWTALTSETDQKVNDQNLLVFETWLTPAAMKKLIVAEEKTSMEKAQKERAKLEKPNQFGHHKAQLEKSAPHNVGVLVTVRYSPSAAAFTVKNQLFRKSVLNKMLEDGKTDIPDFPNTALTLKPTYEVLTKDTLEKNNGYYKLNVWSGPNPLDSLEGDGEGTWKGYVYIDPDNGGQGDGSVDDGQGRTPQNTYNLKDFIYYKLTKKEAAELDATFNADIKEGDPVVLVAMHTTSKEIKRWTWQTFWWTPDADNPPAPSSAQTASLRPSQLQGGASHYAMSYAYTFTYPNQPYTGGDNKGESIYTFNPYLEAGFAFGTDLTTKAYVITNGKTISNNSGVRTNCMTCHANATYTNDTSISAPGYLGDTYIDLNDQQFHKTLKLDFAWSIEGNLIND